MGQWVSETSNLGPERVSMWSQTIENPKLVRTKFLLKTSFRLLKNLIKNKNNKNNRHGGAEFLCKHYPPT
jgi:hypothetical protein